MHDVVFAADDRPVGAAGKFGIRGAQILRAAIAFQVIPVCIEHNGDIRIQLQKISLILARFGDEILIAPEMEVAVV